MSTANLSRLIDLVEAKLAGLPAIEHNRYDGFAAHTRAACAALDELVQTEGARWRRAGDAINLTLGGIRASATGGESAAMRNWLNGARRRVGGQAS